MSICGSCGLDLETGLRVGLDDDLAPPSPVRAETLPIPIGVIGGVCLLASLIFTITTLSFWLGGREGYQYFIPLCVFGVFASVQFLRRKSARLLLMALTFGLAIDIVALIALPIYQAHTDISPVRSATPTDDPDQPELIIPSALERLDLQKVKLGLGLIAAYAGVGSTCCRPRPGVRSGPNEARSRMRIVRIGENPHDPRAYLRVRFSPPLSSAHAVAASSGLRQIERIGKRIRAASSAVAVDDSNPSSAAARSIPVCPSARRTRAAGERVR